jgi:hypothetical protein
MKTSSRKVDLQDLNRIDEFWVEVMEARQRFEPQMIVTASAVLEFLASLAEPLTSAASLAAIELIHFKPLGTFCDED